jgi:hypothetical protein
MIFTSRETDVNQLAYRRLKPEIDQKYPRGHFVGIDEGKVVADAPSFEELDARLNSMGKPSNDVLVVQAGDETPEFAWILSLGSRS